VGPRDGLDAFENGKNLLPLSGMESRLLGRPTPNLVTDMSNIQGSIFPLIFVLPSIPRFMEFEFITGNTSLHVTYIQDYRNFPIGLQVPL
jgi:hypothetical protein